MIERDGVQESQIRFEDYESTIQDYARVALRKVKQPSIYDFEDLYQEGYSVFLCARNYYKPEKSKATFKTYLVSALRNHFCDLVQKTYKRIDTRTGFEPSLLALIHSSNNTESITTILVQHKENFSDIEFKYITFLLNMPKEIQDEIKHCIGKRRQVIRRELQIAPYVETQIRKSIRTKLTVVA